MPGVDYADAEVEAPRRLGYGVAPCAMDPLGNKRARAEFITSYVMTILRGQPPGLLCL